MLSKSIQDDFLKMYIFNLHVGTEYTHIVDLGSLVENTIPSDKKQNCVHKSLQLTILEGVYRMNSTCNQDNFSTRIINLQASSHF